MKKNELKNIELDLDKKFIKLYTATYETNNVERKYFFVSRNNYDDLSIVNKKSKISAIEGFTYFKDKDGNYKVVMIREFRSALGRYVYSFCAGLVENGEEPDTALKREVEEELGAKVKNIEWCQNYPMATSAGLTDESNMFAIVELDPDKMSSQKLEETEDIDVIIYNVDELDTLVKNNKLELTLPGYLGITLLTNRFSGKRC